MVDKGKYPHFKAALIEGIAGIIVPLNLTCLYILPFECTSETKTAGFLLHIAL